MTSPGEIALRLQDQGWRGLLPLLPHDAMPHVRLAPDKVAEVEAGRGKAPGRWARAGWSLQPDWRALPDDAETVEGGAHWPCNYPQLSTRNQRLAGFVQIVSLCAELFKGPPRQVTLSGSNIDRSRNYNGPAAGQRCG